MKVGRTPGGGGCSLGEKSAEGGEDIARPLLGEVVLGPAGEAPLEAPDLEEDDLEGLL